ncbi:thiamine pyrophosphate-binding protein [Saccharopolyspora hordei]|uniref:Acetolactate synthase-1/2/3 large subunit n=1 Tax=Saccharopolyspora hordei TaxID=1838 RepID=A0A853AGT4_9PSEU|nr:thiamine pyrophosphate-binding protein [Saccharopolyspora hordei]NYI82309.1 acetolactate synthase-1/2/3 large subunit [Saccharopolyspora hordei]
MSDHVEGAWAAVLEVLRQHGVRTLFGLPGDDLELLSALERAAEPPRLVLCRDQRNALFMATGQALHTGSVAVAVIGKGPAVTNATTGLLEATCSRAPVVLVGAGTDVKHRGARAFQELDQVSALAPLTKWAHRVDHPDRLVPALRRALLVATQGAPGPVYLEVPDHLLTAEVLVRGAGPVVSGPTGSAVVPEPVRASRRPLLLVGGGMRHRNGDRVVERLAERLGAAVFSTASGRGAVDEDHPHFLGLSGLYAAPATAPLWSTVDCVVSLGSRLEETATFGWPEPIGDSVPVVQLNVDGAEFSADFSGPCLTGDAAATVEHWLAGDLGTAASRAEWAGLVTSTRQRVLADHRAELARLAGSDEPLRVPEVLAAVQRTVPADRVLVQENGLQDMWSYFFPNYRCGRDGGSVVPSEQTSLGFGAAAAAGVKVADPHRPVLALVGDGAFTLFSSDLRTLVQERIGVCYLVLRNGGYGWLQQQAEQHDPPLSGFCFTRDEGPLVRTPGVHHAVVQRRDALVAALSEAVRVAADGTPSVVEVPVSLDDSALRPDGDFGTAH